MGLRDSFNRRRRKAARGRAEKRRRMQFEALEPRSMLAAAGLIPVGQQPTGPLSGKIVYTSGGHGWQWNDTLARWATDRGDNNEIVEDFGNQDQLTFYVEYLLRAGATVVPMRPVGRQINEVVLDNDSAGVTYTGAWTDSTTGSRWYDEDYGAVADPVRYRFASTSAGSETASATYTPTIPQAGYYPIYTWVAAGSNRTSQLYKINHTAGQTEIRVDHSMVGNGWVYLGTYYFEQGASAAAGSVTIGNQGTAGRVVVADAIRFGNGMGDMKDGPAGVGAASGTISGYPREDENSLMWVWRAVGQGVTPSSIVGASNVSAPAAMAENMNANTNPFGTAVYIGFHSNAGGGRGARGLINAAAADLTPHQADLALYTGRQINQDMTALNGTFEYSWSGPANTFSGAFGEIDDGDFINSSGVVEMDATIIEVGFHDSVEDASLMRDPKVRDQLARSTYEATLEYFDNWGGLVTPVATPSAPINVRAESTTSGSVTLAWNAGPTGVLGAAATGYRIYASVDGQNFDGGSIVLGGATTTATIAGYDPTLPYYFRIVATNAGGESAPSEAATALPAGGPRQVLIVNGFDRNERQQNVRYPYAFVGDGLVDRVRPRANNSFDYVVQVATALHAAAPTMQFASASNEAVVNGSVDLADFDAVIWILGEESTSTDTFSATEQAKVAAYLNLGGDLFVSGSEIGYDLDAQGGGASFYNTGLKADYVADDAGSYNVAGAAGSIFAGLNFSFDNGTQFYDVNAPDRIAPLGGAISSLSYGSGGSAAIQYSDPGTGSQIVMLAFPFETITSAATRASVLGAVLGYFDSTFVPAPIDAVLDNDDGPSVYAETGAWTTPASPGYNGLTYRFAPAGSAATAAWQFAAPYAGPAQVMVQYRSGPNRADSAVFKIDTGSGIETVAINQKLNDLTWISLGTFNFSTGVRTITLDAAASTGGSIVVADVVRVMLAPPPPTPDADFNGDGEVDGADLLAWQIGLGTATGATPAQGDADGDQDVDAADLAAWQGQFVGAGGSVAAAGASFAAAQTTASTGEGAAGWIAQRTSASREIVAQSEGARRLRPEPRLEGAFRPAPRDGRLLTAATKEIAGRDLAATSEGSDVDARSAAFDAALEAWEADAWPPSGVRSKLRG